MARTGGCICGAVRYEAEGGPGFGACHCGTCRRWASGPFMAMQTHGLRITQGEDQVRVFKSSDWATRSFCGVCGSNLWYRLEGAEPEKGFFLSVGTLDDQSGLELTEEVFSDHKPESYDFFRQASRKVTETELFAQFGAGG